MSAQVVGTIVTARLVAGEKYRVTWAWSLAAILPAWAFNTVGAANQIHEWLSSSGFIPISLPSAKAGDEVIVFDVQVAAYKAGRTVAQMLSDLEAVPFTMYVARLEKLKPAQSSQELAQGQAAAVDQGNATVDVTGRLFDWLEGIGGKVATVLIVGGVVALAYFATRKR